MAEIKQKVERVQLGVRMEARLVKVLKGLAEFNDETLGELLEKIVLHSFEPVPGDEGEASASPHSKAQLKAIDDLKKVDGQGVVGDGHGERPVPVVPAEGDLLTGDHDDAGIGGSALHPDRFDRRPWRRAGGSQAP